LVRVLSGMLRISVALDRGHTQVVKRLSAKRTNGSLELVVGGVGDLELELWAARRKIAPLAQALGLEVRVVSEAELHGLAAPAGPELSPE
jgi:exopolyphosphatase/guanosine-5'-triphosphate,3'-diphosphate pyrophosphatase